MDAVEQPHRFFRLVRLQLANEMQFDFAVRIAQFGPFLCRLLHPVFAENALARRDQRGDALRRMRLADRHKRDVPGPPPRKSGGGGDAGADICEVVCWLFHRAML